MKTPAASTRLGEYSLAIDTSAGTTVAVLAMGSVLAELNYLEPMTHSERIGSAIEQVIRDAGIEANQISTVVAGIGPGPFTGLRVGLAAARYFAIGVSAQLVGVCSLDSIALDFYAENPEAKNLFGLVKAILADPFCRAQIGELYVDEGGEVTLYPLVGDQEIILGKPEGYTTKLLKLKSFYQDIVPARGWERYNTVNLKYENQIVCE